MPVKKPSAKPTRAKKTVSAKAIVKPSAKSAVKAKPARTTTAPKVPAKSAARAAVAEPVVNREKPPVDMQIVNEEMEGDVRTSLLSGPRNVKPYVVRKDEEYMSKEQLDHFRRILGI